MFEGTPESHELCEYMARVNKGVCVLGFSRGKDSLAAWLFLRQYFDKIYPFHMTPIPGLGFIERSLSYYETVFDTKIERYLSPETFGYGIANLQFQPVEDDDLIGSMKLWEYDHQTVA